MANKLFNLILDLSGHNLVPHIDIRRNDYDSNVFSVQVTQGGLPFDFTGMNPIFECLTPDGHYIRDDGSQYGTIHVVEATQGKLEYTLVNEIFSVLGQIDVAYFAFEQSNADLQNPTNRVSTGNFSMRIIADALTGTTAAADYMSDVTTLIQQINQLKTDYQTLNPANYITQTQFGTQNDSFAAQLAEKANQLYVDQVMSSLSNGGPDEIFYSISALNIAYPSGTNRTKLVFDSSFTDGAHSMIWNGSVWEDAGLYQGNGVVDGTVSKDSLNVTIQNAVLSAVSGTTSKNLFNKFAATYDKYVDYTNGTLKNPTDGNIYYASDWIPVQPNSQYTITAQNRIAFYDNSKNYLSGTNGSNAPYTLTTPANAAYMRITILLTNFDSFQVEVGSVNTNYVPYTLPSMTAVPNKYIPNKKLSFFTTAKNLFDKDAATHNKYIQTATGQMRSPSIGGDFYASDWIEVQPSTQYTLKYQYQLAFYDDNQQLISGIESSGSPLTNYTFITPSNAAYVRFTVQGENISTQQLEFGTLATPFEAFGLCIPQNILDKPTQDALNNVSDQNNSLNKNERDFGYNIKNGLANFKAKLLSSASQLVRINCVGDSLTRGEYASYEPTKSWVGVLRSLLQGNFGNAPGEGFINTYEAELPAGAQPRWTLGSGWSTSSGGGYGHYYAQSSGALTATTCTFSGTSAVVIYAQASSGGMVDITVDGIAKGSINCQNGTTTFGKLFTISGLTDGQHTISFTPETTGYALIEGMFANGAASTGVQMNRLGRSGWQASDWISNINTIVLPSWNALPADLTVLGLGMNDVRYVTADQYKANMQTLINSVLSTGSEILLIAYHRPSPSWSGNWARMIKVLYELADENNIGLVDIFQAFFESYDMAQSFGLFGPGTNDYSGSSGTNTAHPGDKGYAYIANIIEPLLVS